jgi:hypothetical protein
MDEPKDQPRYPAKPYNRIVPRSQRSSGTELDECCEPGFQQPAKQEPTKEA